MRDTDFCVVFDLDDTLYLERDYVASGFRAIDMWLQTQVGIAGFFDAAWRAFHNGVRGTIFNHALGELGDQDDPELVGRLVEIYRAHEPQIDLLGDASSCLDELAGNVVLGLITDGPAVSQRAKARALGVGQFIPEMVFTEELGPGLSKPHTMAFELVQRRTSTLGPRCVYVADNPAKDFSGPKRLGWSTVRVRRRDGLHAGVVSGSDVDVEVTDLSDLHVLIADLGGRSPKGNGALC